MAARPRGHPTEPGEPIHHPDARSQYTSLRLTEHLALREIRPSNRDRWRRPGGVHQRPLQDRVHRLPTPAPTRPSATYATAGWVAWYNNHRLHSTLGNVPPVEYEEAHYAALNREPHSV
jgi:putative transposase